VQELMSIRREFLKAKEDFLADYDQNIQTWIDRHSQWAEIIRSSTVGPDYVRARMSFKWQMFKVAPLQSHADQAAVLEAGLAEEVTGLGSTLFGEVAHDAEDMWKRVYMGKNEVTHRALSPLKTLHAKLTGLSFVEPHVAPVADIIMSALNRMPKRGNINGPDLLMLQGLVCLLKDSDTLIAHAQSLIVGNSADSVLDSLLPVTPELSTDAAQMDNPATNVDTLMDNANDDAPVLPDILPQAPSPEIPSYGLW